MTDKSGGADSNEHSISTISASSVTVSVTDDSTGRTFSRTLPIDYFENANGIRLQGEDMQGQPAEIVFLSSTALNKIKDMTGKGPDSPPHHD